MVAEWKEYKLDDIVEMQTKKIDSNLISIENYISTENMLPNKGGIKVASGLPEQDKYLEFKKDDVLFSNIRTYFRKVWQASFDGGASNDVIVFRTKNNEILDQKYLFNILSSEKFIEFTVATAKGTKMPRGDKSAMKTYNFSLPVDIKEQKAISFILEGLDKKIVISRQMNQNLELMSQALFKSWFVDFNPIIDNALLNGNPIPEVFSERSKRRKKAIEKFNTLPKEIQMLFPSEFEQTNDMGWIPKGWKVMKVADVADVVGGGTPSTKVEEYFSDNGIAWLSPKDLSGYEWKHISKGATDITELGLSKSSAKLMPKGTVLFSSRAPIGYVAIAENEISTNQGFKSLVPKEKMCSEYLYHFLKCEKDNIEAIATGSTFKEVSGTAIKTFNILVPDVSILTEFEKQTDDLNSKRLINRNEVTSLTKLRDTLLPQLISGKLRIDEIETILKQIESQENK